MGITLSVRLLALPLLARPALAPRKKVGTFCERLHGVCSHAEGGALQRAFMVQGTGHASLTTPDNALIKN
jgi:hypothetical protein